MVFRNRFEAGRELAAKLRHYRARSDVLVLALPRGGLPVAFEVASALGAPLDIAVVRKLGLPGHEELAMGAVASGGIRVLNNELVDHLRIPEKVIDQVAGREIAEVQRQEKLYRGGRPAPQIAGRTIILVDDGLATGSTMRAAVQALRKLKPRQIVVGVPVGAPDTCEELRDLADEVVCAVSPREFHSVGTWYADFSPTSDKEVEGLLEEADRWRRSAAAAAERERTHVSSHGAS